LLLATFAQGADRASDCSSAASGSHQTPVASTTRELLQFIRMEQRLDAGVTNQTASLRELRYGKQMAQAVPGQRPVVLVVEDESLIRTTAIDMVEDAGFEAIAASDADEAIRILESRNDIRAIFTDVQMPGSMDGLRLARVVRNRWPPVALIVTSGQTNVAEGHLPTGGRFLRKPYEAAHVGALLQELIAL